MIQLYSDTKSGVNNDEDEEREVEGETGESIADRVAARHCAHFASFDDLLLYDMEEFLEEDEMPAKSMINDGFLPSYFYTGFNDPIDPSYSHVAHSNSSNPPTLFQATNGPDWNKWKTAIQDELKSFAAFETFEVVDLPPVRDWWDVNMFSK